MAEQRSMEAESKLKEAQDKLKEAEAKLKECEMSLKKEKQITSEQEKMPIGIKSLYWFLFFQKQKTYWLTINKAFGCGALRLLNLLISALFSLILDFYHIYTFIQNDDIFWEKIVGN